MADKALYIGIDATSKSVPLKAVDNGDGSYALKVSIPPGVVVTYPQKVQTLAPLAYWSFGDSGGTTALDSSGNNYPAAYKASGEPLLAQTGWSTDGRTSALFDGSNDYCNVYGASLAAAFNPAEFSFSGWLRVPIAGTWIDATARRFLYWQADTSNRLIFQKSTVNNQLDITYQAGGVARTVNVSINTTNWFHVLVTVSKSADLLKVYINGIENPTFSNLLGTWAGTLASTVTCLGATNTSGGSPWKGNMQDNAVWTRALVAADAAWLSNKTRMITFEGDSRTTSSGGLSYSQYYPTQCMALLNNTTYGWVNVSAGGDTLTTMLTQAAAQVDAQYKSGFAANSAVLLGGVNDALASGGGANAATIYSRIVSWYAGRKAAGIRPLICTEIDAQSTSANAVSWHSSVWPTLNALLRAGTDIPSSDLIDLGADVRLQNALDLTYFQPDAIHPNTTGAGVIAGLVAAKL